MNEDSVYPLTNENATLSLEEPKPKEFNTEVLTSSSNGAVHTKDDSETPKSTKNQVLHFSVVCMFHYITMDCLFCLKLILIIFFFVDMVSSLQ
jgi:regulator of replication initiation timing